jgi:LPXTG-motif cell wall-anchored protein
LLVDAVSYEGNTGAPYTEGTGFTGGDDNTSVNLAFVRFPDGVDTNNNNADWRTQRMSPGLPNTGLPGSNPLSLGLGAAALALLGGIAVMSRRRRAVA